jgi:two-component system LytT family response regulator
VQAARPPGARVERILVRDGAKVVVIAAADLDYADAQDDYVGLHSKGKVHLKQQTLAELEASLDPRASCASTAPSCSTSIDWPA